MAYLAPVITGFDQADIQTLTYGQQARLDADASVSITHEGGVSLTGNLVVSVSGAGMYDTLSLDLNHPRLTTEDTSTDQGGMAKIIKVDGQYVGMYAEGAAHSFLIELQEADPAHVALVLQQFVYHAEVPSGMWPTPPGVRTFTIALNETYEDPVTVTTTLVVVERPTFASPASLPGQPGGLPAAENLGVAISALAAGSAYADGDHAPLAGIAIDGDASTADQGVWQYALAGTDLWYDIRHVASDNALILAADTLLRFAPVADFSGSPGALSVRPIDTAIADFFFTDDGSEARLDLTDATALSPAIGLTSVAWGANIEAPATPPSLSADSTWAIFGPQTNTITDLFQNVLASTEDDAQVFTGFELKVFGAGASERLSIRGDVVNLSSSVTVLSHGGTVTVTKASGVHIVTVTDLLLDDAGFRDLIDGLGYLRDTSYVGGPSPSQVQPVSVLLTQITDSGPNGSNTSTVNELATVTRADFVNGAAPSIIVTPTASSYTFTPGVVTSVTFEIDVKTGLTLVGSTLTFNVALPLGWTAGNLQGSNMLTGVIAISKQQFTVDIEPLGTDTSGAFPISVLSTLTGLSGATLPTVAVGGALGTVVPASLDPVPTVEGTGLTPTFVEDEASVALFDISTATTGKDGQVFTGAVFTVSGVADGSAEVLTVGGTAITLASGAAGTVASGGSFSVTLVQGVATVTVTGLSLDDADMQSWIQSAAYQNTSDAPTGASREVSLVQVSTDSSNTPAKAVTGITATVSLEAVNDAPTFAAPEGGVTHILPGTAGFSVSAAAMATAVQPDGKILVGGYLSDNQQYFAIVRLLADGSLDPTFGDGGKRVLTDVSTLAQAYRIEVLDDGRIVMAGSDFANQGMLAVRLTADGNLDTSFGDGGKTLVTTANQLQADDMLIQPDGAIVMVGNSYISQFQTPFAAVRLDADGQLDTSFGNQGIAIIQSSVSRAQSVAIDANGNLLLLGYPSQGQGQDFKLARLTPDGQLDSTFKYPANSWMTGVITVDIDGGSEESRVVAVQPDGKILLAGTSYPAGSNYTQSRVAVVRLNADGSPDATFGTNGKVIVPADTRSEPEAMLLMPNGQILIAGHAQGSGFDVMLVRLNADGGLDTTFGLDGVATYASARTELGRDVALLPDGKILVVGYGADATSSNNQFLAIRFNPDGSIDHTFNPRPGQNTLDGVATVTDLDTPVVLDASVRIHDAELAARGHYEGASLTLARQGGADAQDVFGGSGALVLDAALGTLVLDGTTIGTFTQQAGTFTVTFNAQATQTRVDKALSLLTYRFDGHQAPANATIAWTFSDGNSQDAQGSGGVKNTQGETSIVFDLPEPLPSLAATAKDPSYAEGAAAVAFFDTVTADTDGSDQPIVRIMMVVSGLRDGAQEQIIILGKAIALVDGTGTLGAPAAPIGQYTIMTGGDTAMILLHDMALEGAGLQALVQSLSYEHVGEVPTAGERALHFNRVEDSGDDFIEPGLTSVVTVAPINDAPTFTAPVGGTLVLRPDGSPVLVNDSALQPDGKILVVGHTETAHGMVVLRLLPDGTVDTGFGTDGMIQNIANFAQAHSIAVQADGSFVVVGHMNGWTDQAWVAARFLADGTFDTSFGNGGIAQIPTTGTDLKTTAVQVQADGGILIGGYHGDSSGSQATLVRLDATGALDTTFGQNGIWTAGARSLLDVVVQDDGKILLAGQIFPGSWLPSILRLNADGSTDTSFAGTGEFTYLPPGAGKAIGLTAQDGKVVFVTAYFANSANQIDVTQLTATGALDTTFGNGGHSTVSVGTELHVQELLQQPDGKLVVVGRAENDLVVIRLTASGQRDTTFGEDGVVTLELAAPGTARQVMLDAEGRLVVTGESDGSLIVVRLNADGSLDDRFHPQPGQPSLGGEVLYAYTTPDLAVVLDSDVRVYDVELAAQGHYAGASVTLARANATSLNDHFGGSGALTLADGNVVLAGTTIGSYDQLTGALTITFNANATQARVNQALSAITYRHDGPNPPSSVQIAWTFNDGNAGSQGSGGNLSAQGTTTVIMNAEPSDISVSVTAIDENTSADQAIIIGQLSTTDLDASDTFTYSIVGGADKNVFAIDGNVLQFKAGTVLDYETQSSYTVRVRTTDSHGATFERDITIDVNDVNETPTLATPLSDRVAEAGKAFTFTLPTGTFVDPDAGDVLTYVAELDNGDPLPDWLVLDPQTGALSGTAPADTHGFTVKLFAQDADGLSAHGTFGFTVANAPAVTAIVRDANTTGPTNATTLTFEVTFNEVVQGVDASDFVLTSSGSATGTVSQIQPTGDGTSFIVTVVSVSGEGDLRLDLKTTGTGITSDLGLPIAGGYTAGQSYEVDQSQPVVTAIAPPADGIYGIGDTLDFTVTFSEAVNVQGTPTLVFAYGDAFDPVPLDVQAAYVSGSGTNTLVFRLTVQDGWPEGYVLAANFLKLNGGKLLDAAGNAADLFPEESPLFLGITLDGEAPDAPQIDSGELTKLDAPVLTGTAEIGSTVTVSVGGAVFTVTAENGQWTLDLGAVDPDDGSPALSLNLNGSNGVSVTATDAAGNTSAPATQTLVIDTSAPDAPTGITLPEGITNQTSVSIDLDALEADATWQYSLDGGDTWFDGEGASFVLAEGNYETGDIQVRQVDAAGNAGEPLRSQQAVTIDITPPQDPVVDTATLTNAVNPTVGGTAEPGAVVSVLVAGANYVVTADADTGQWQVTLGVTPPLSGSLNLQLNGANSILVAVKDAAGNDSGTITHTLTIDTTPPAPLGTNLPNAAYTKTDTVTVDLTHLETGATWQFSLDGGLTWTQGQGDSFSLDEITYGAGQIQVRQVDVAGNAGPSASNAAELTVDVTPPGAPTFTSPTLTNVGAPVISGAVEPGSVVWVAVEGVSYRIVDTSNGTWTLDLANAIPWYATDTLVLNLNGANVINVTATDAAGNVSAPRSQTLTIDTTDPLAPTGVTLPQGGPTNVDTVTVDLDTLEPEATWQYSVDGGQTWIDGDDTGTFTLDERLYAPGEIQVRQVDEAGNVSPAIMTQSAVLVDVTAPGQPVITSAALSNAAAPIITGTAETGSTVTVSVGGAVYTVAVSQGEWTLDLSSTPPDVGSAALSLNANGSNVISVTATDAAGNTSEAGEQTLVIDTTGPLAPTGVTLPEGGPTNVDTITVDLGTLEPGATWQYSLDGGQTWTDGDATGTFHLADATYAAGDIQVRQIDSAGNPGLVAATSAEVVIDTVAPTAPSIDSVELTRHAAPVLHGTAEVGSTVTVSVGDAVYTVSATDGTWTLDLSTTAPDTGSPALALDVNGVNDIVVKATDAAGNVSEPGTQSLVIDTDAPQAPTGITLPEGGPTNVNTVTVDLQALEPGATWQYSLDGGDTWLDGDPTGSFVLQDATYAAGDIQVRQIDAAGNVGVVIKTGAEVLIDTVEPDAPTFTTGKLTNKPTPVLSGLAEAGSAVSVSIGGTVFTVIATDGTWTLDLATALPDEGAPALALDINGSNHVVIVATDAAGNISEIGQQNLSIDTTDPDAPTGVELPAGGPTNNTDVVIDLAALEKNATWQYSTDGGQTWNAGEGDRFTLDEGVYAEGAIQVRQIDAAGNAGAVVKTLAEVIIDTTPPAEAVVTSPMLSNLALPVLRGTAEPGSLVVVYLGTAEFEIQTVDGHWELDLATTAPSYGTLALDVNGPNTFFVEVIDTAGNWSEETEHTLVIDTTDPEAPAGVTLPEGGPTNVNTVTVDLDALEADATWQYSVDGGQTWLDGDDTGTFTLQDGNYLAGSIQVRQVDAAGNAGVAATTHTDVSIDTVAPTVPTVGSAALTSNAKPIVSGTAEDGSVLTVTVGGATYTTTAQGGRWQVNLATATPVEGTLALNVNGSNPVTVTATDAAGNVSTAGAQSLVIDTTPPAPLKLAFTATDAHWVIQVNNLEGGATWQYQLAGGDWISGQGSSFTVPMGPYASGAILVRQTDAAGNVSTLAGNPGLTRPVTDLDGDGLDDDIENGVPGMDGGQQGDGNGDGIPDVEQADVTSLPWLQTPDGQIRYVTLVNDSGLTQQAVTTARIDTTTLPQALTLPVGALAFTVRNLPEGGVVTFSVFLDKDIPVNGYWKQVDGQWINIATAITEVGGKTRIDFQIEDGGPLDADGARNGVIVDPGAPGWFEGNPHDVDGDQVPDLLELGLGLTPGVKDNDVFARDDLFVMQVYRDALGREADKGGLGYWKAELGSGLSREAFLTHVLTSTEALDSEPLARLTLSLLDRAPQATEWSAWRDGVAHGQTTEALADAFVLAHYGQADDAAFIDQLYVDALGRDADAGGRAYWVQSLADGSSRGDVALQFVQSAEALQAQGQQVEVTLLYASLLGRGADAQGLAYWGQALSEGASLGAVAVAIVGSAEYHDRFLPSQEDAIIG